MASYWELPGAVNAHTHLYSALVPLGMPEPAVQPQCFEEILKAVWWRLDRALDATILTAAARYYVAHALLAGTTTLIDHHESPCFIEHSLDVLANACASLGVRAVLCYGATERNAGPDEALRGLAENRRFAMQHQSGLIRAMVGLHASFTVSDATLRDAGGLCRELQIPLHVHLAEDPCDVRDAQRRGYPGPLERLIACDALPSGSILAHGVHLAESQVAMATERGAWFVQNPRSNKHNRVGIPKGFVGARNVALGTDGFPSDLRDEVHALREELGRTVADEPELQLRLAGGRMLAIGIFGADAIAQDRIRVANDGSQRVLDVEINGRAVVRDGTLVHASLKDIETTAHAAALTLWNRMKDLP